MAKKSETPKGAALVGSKLTEDNCPAGCVTAKCFCVCDDNDNCVACVHVDGGEVCLCVKDKEGTVKHVKLNDVLALVQNVT